MANHEQVRPAVCPTLRYRDAHAAIAFLTEAFGFITSALHEDAAGQVAHAELCHRNGVVMIGSVGGEGAFAKAAQRLGPSSIYVSVLDTDRHHERAVAHGARVVIPLTDQEYGSRDYTAEDPEGNLWTFGTYLPELNVPQGC